MSAATTRSDRPRDGELTTLVEAMLASYRGDPEVHHINRRYLPSRAEIINGGVVIAAGQ